MIHLLFPIIFAEMALVLTLMFRTPLRKMVIMGLDLLKQGKGRVMVRTVAGTMFVVLISIFHNVREVQKRLMDVGSVNPTDQVLMANQLLEATLMGFSLFLALIIHQLHYYMKEIHLLRTSLEEVKKQYQKDYDDQDRKSKGAKETKASEEGISPTWKKDKQPEFESKMKPREAKAAPETDTAAVKGTIKKNTLGSG